MQVVKSRGAFLRAGWTCGGTVIGFAALLSACAVQVEDPELEAEVEVAEEPIRNGTELLGRRGVIQFGFGVFEHPNCNGILISDRSALTAAHCTEQANTRTQYGTMRRTVRYYDPIWGARPITYENELLTVRTVGTWDGLNHPAGSVIDHQDDLAVVTRSTPWHATSAADYVSIWIGTLAEADKNTLYAAGPNSRDGVTGTGTLRSMAIDIWDYSTYWFSDIARSRQVCLGDSGGPYLFTYSGIDTVLGVLARIRGGLSGSCAADGASQIAARIGTRISWIEDTIRLHLGLPSFTCTRIANRKAARCF